MPFKILVAGQNGQVAQALGRLGQAGPHAVTCLGRPQLDITSRASIDAALDRVRPDIVINAAAYTAVDQAEREPQNAALLNAEAPGWLAAAAARRGAMMIHLSTDYVFDGQSSAPYLETDYPNPQSVYGHTKLAGEAAVLNSNEHALIFRTAWVYSPFGKNFVRTMLTLAKDRDEVSVVNDQIGNPTSALDIAAALLAICTQLEAGAPDGDRMFHLCAPDSAAWDAVAREVFAISARLGGQVAEVRSIPSADYPTPVKRPANSRLDCAKLQQVFGLRLPNWQESLVPCVTELISGLDKS